MKQYTDTFEQVAKIVSSTGVSMEEAATAFRNLAQMGYDIPTMDEMVANDVDLHNRISQLEANTYTLIDGADSQIISVTANIDNMKNNLTDLQVAVDQLRTEMSVLTEKPKRKVDLEIFDQIFDNSDFPFLESDIFPEIDFNINI